ncbi:MAG: hypothetical protein ACI8UO_000329 [Verrucomicrobiales bacterium]
MTIAEFLNQLQDSGEVLFKSPEPPELDSPSEAEAIQQLLALDQRRRLEAAHEAPRLRIESALWAARLMFRVCQFLVYRSLPASLIETDLREPCPGNRDAEQAWSVDLVLSRLPEFTQRAVQIAEADPLVQQMLLLAWEWPLSSVGIPLDVSEDGPVPDLTTILSQPTLQALYVDRIFETGDTSRLHDPEIRAAVANTLGGHPELAPTSEFADLLRAEA